MKSKMRLSDHPLHPMLVGFPIAYYIASFIGYSVYANNSEVFWFKFGYVANIAGVVFAILAAVPGMVDWLYVIPKQAKAKDVGMYHMVLNVSALILFAANWGILSGQWNAFEPQLYQAVLVTGLGVILTGVAGYLGGELVNRHKIGVDLDEVSLTGEGRVTTKTSENSQIPPRVS